MKLKNFTDLNAWAVEQWGDAELGDTRRTQRAIAIGAAIAANPQGSLPDMMQGWNEIRAAYRLFAEDDVTHKALIQPHITETKQRATEIKSNVVLFIQDTTELDYTHHREVKGLGHIGDGKGRGMMLHTCLAVVPLPLNPQILGLAGQIPWLRSQKKDNDNTLVEALPELLRTDGEGEIWAEMVESIGTAPTPQTGSIWVSVGDRGSDIFSYLRRAKALYWHCLVRVTQNRVITKPDATKGYLKAFARSLQPMAEKTVVLRGRNGEPKRKVNLQVAWSQLTIQPPAIGCERKQQPIDGWCIRCWEPEGDLEWILFTTVAVNDREDALMQLDWYATRWLIEEYHKCLKTGCAVEKRQLESASSLVRLLGFFAIVSVRLLQLRQLSRSNSQLKAHEYIPTIMLKVLVARLGLTNCELTLGEFFLAIARLGGFLGRKSDGLPGWQTLWRGWLRLQDMCWAADFITQ
ncbi:MAG: IS4 family transposase, partial [Nostoc sp. DedSLP03]|uniref:IS4 family transposase n=1 Tax=Nostoc sp. DedSLP03 TaxID=3075400 RepID=UPI002AD3549B